MFDEIKKLIDEYGHWVRSKTNLREIDKGIVEITTPYLDRHNDFVQLYVKKTATGFCITDGGYIIDDLELSGCDLNSPKRQDILRTTLNGFGVQFNMESRELFVDTGLSDFSFKKHNLVQAVLAVNDMFFMASPVVHSLFIESVVNWLDLKDVRYTQNVSFTGKTGYTHIFDFVIPKSRKAPERIVKAINNPNKETAQSFVLSWIDTRENRPAEAKAYAFLNDTEREISNNVSTALRNYGIIPLSWSKKETSETVFTD